MLSKASSTSSLVSAIDEYPARRTLKRTATASYQPHRRGRPVDVPYSAPRSRRLVPWPSSSSVGNGPAPTAVVYAFATPMTLSIRTAGRPAPRLAPPGIGDELVT